MAKVPFSKLQASINSADCEIGYYNKAGDEIKYEVKNYLPFKDKLELVSKIINQSIDDNGFYNPMRVKMYMTLEIVYAYTNLNFTEKMREDPFKLYDILISTGIFADIIKVISADDWKEIQENVWSTIKNIYDYRNSAMGILSFIASDYSAVEMDASKIQELLSNSENLELLKQVVTKLG
jgi:hypothetical protein